MSNPQVGTRSGPGGILTFDSDQVIALTPTMTFRAYPKGDGYIAECSDVGGASRGDTALDAIRHTAEALRSTAEALVVWLDAQAAETADTAPRRS